MPKRKPLPKNNPDKVLSRRNLIITSIVGLTVILTFVIELPQKLSEAVDVFRTAVTPILISTPEGSSTSTLEPAMSSMTQTLTPIKRIITTTMGRRITVSLTPESGPPGTSFEIKFYEYEFGGSILVELVDPCDGVIESRNITAIGFGDIQQSFTTPRVSPIPGMYNPCLYGIYKAVFTNESDNESLSVNFIVIEPAE